MDKRVLFLGAGRRTELIKRFKDRGYMTFAYELEKNVPVYYEADKLIQGLPWDHTNIHNHIVENVQEYKIDLIIPCQDLATLVLAATEDINGVVSPFITSLLCYNKKRFSLFMNKHFKDNYPNYVEGQFYIKKPKHGFGARGIEKIYESTPPVEDSEHVYQRLLNGIEFSVDAFFSKDSIYIDSVPRTRDRVAGGEVVVSKTVRSDELQSLVKDVGTKLGVSGPANFQIIIEKDVPYIFEVNCRFGGGYTLSIEAGLDAISLIEREFLGIAFDYTPNQWTQSLTLHRSFKDYFFNENSDRS